MSSYSDEDNPECENNIQPYHGKFKERKSLEGCEEYEEPPDKFSKHSDKTLRKPIQVIQKQANVVHGESHKTDPKIYTSTRNNPVRKVTLTKVRKPKRQEVSVSTTSPLLKNAPVWEAPDPTRMQIDWRSGIKNEHEQNSAVTFEGERQTNKKSSSKNEPVNVVKENKAPAIEITTEEIAIKNNDHSGTSKSAKEQRKRKAILKKSDPLHWTKFAYYENDKLCCNQQECREIGLFFGRPDSLQRHVYNTHDPKIEVSPAQLQVRKRKYNGKQKITRDDALHWTSFARYEDDVLYCNHPDCMAKEKKQSYAKESKLQRHVDRNHNPVKEYFMCDLCPDRQFASKDSLAQHKRNLHGDRKKETTVNENRPRGPNGRFVNKRNNDFNWRSCFDEKEKKYFCNKCIHEPYAHLMGIWRHVEFEHNPYKNLHQCSQCNKVFVRIWGLSRHVKEVHCTESPRYKCVKCLKVYKRMETLRLHILAEHIGDHHICELCEEVFVYKAGLTRHIAAIHNDGSHNCMLCDSNFNRKDQLRVHMKNTHSQFYELVDTEAFEPSSKVLKCPVAACAYTAVNHHSLRFHLGVSHNCTTAEFNLDLVCVETEEEEFAFMEASQLDDLRYSCCGYTIVNEEAFKVHINLYHIRAAWLRSKIVPFSQALYYGTDREKMMESLMAMWNISSENLGDIDSLRKLYVMALVPSEVTENDVQSYLAKKDSVFWLYAGKNSLVVRLLGVFPHHISPNEYTKLSTHRFVGITKCNAYHICDIPLDKISSDSGNSKTNLGRQEALLILKLFLASHMNKKDNFFQKLEFQPLKGIEEAEMNQLLKEVQNCNGDIFRLNCVKVQFVKKIEIVIKNDDTNVLKCSVCEEEFPSLFHKQKHELKSHEIRSGNALGKLLQMEKTEAKTICKIVNSCQIEKIPSVYVVIGSKSAFSGSVAEYKKLKNRLELVLYVGQCSGGIKISDYHKAAGPPSSLKRLKKEGYKLYHLLSFKCNSESEMYKLETTLIFVGLIKRTLKKLSSPTIKNRNVLKYELSRYFPEREEFQELLDFGCNDEDLFFPSNRPSFLKKYELVEVEEEITQLLEFI